METELELIWKLGTSLAIGLLIGIERGWHGRTEDEGDRVAGIRTFSLTGILGGVWAMLLPHTGEIVLGLVFVAFAGLIIASYVYEQQEPNEQDIGITTEIGLLLTFTLAAWAAFGYQVEALATAVVVTTLLGIKPVLHNWLQNLEVEVIYAALKLLIISVVLLPLLPNQGYGPWDTLNPYWIWWMVVLISGLSFLGYIFVKYAGEDKGIILTSVIGGLASSTAVTISLAQFAKQHKKGSPHLFVAGVLIASAIMLIRVFIEVSVVNRSLLTPLWIPLTVMLTLTIGCVLWLWIRSEDEPSDENPTLDLGNPLQLPTALKFGAILAVILVLATTLQQWFGDQGVYLLSLFSGLIDVDAITLSLSKMADTEISASVATLGIVIAVISNTLVKAGLFVFWVGWKKSLELLWMILIISAGGVTSFLLIV